jgi:hypothetical protein
VPKKIAQDAVDEPRAFRLCGFGDLDRFIDRGVGWNLIEVKQLIKGYTQQVAIERIGLG